MSTGVRVVTDSTASLPRSLAERWGVGVVPLDVIVDGTTYREGEDLDTEDLVRALARRAKLGTSQPSPHAFTAAYRRAAEDGATRIVSVHLSGELSGTVHAAALAARTSPVPVEVIDSRTLGMALGYAVLAAARAAASGAPEVEVAHRALTTASTSTAHFVVDSLDHLRRGGRLGATAAAVGTALGLRPVLGLRGGRIEVLQKIRGRAAVGEHFVAAAVGAVESDPHVDLAMHYLGDDAAVRDVATRITAATGRQVLTSPASAVIGVHAGPGLLALVTAREPHLDPVDD